MLRSILFDVAFLGFGGALLFSTVNSMGGCVSLAIGLLAAFAYSAMTKAPRPYGSSNGAVRFGFAQMRFA